jgi:MFS family permease
MKLPSINEILARAATALRRFPLSVICSVIATALLIWTIEKNLELDKHEVVRRLMQLGYLGALLFLTLSFYQERKQLSTAKRWMLQFGGLALLVAYYFFMGHLVSDYERYALYIIATVLTATFAGFISVRNEPGFWQFNKTIVFDLVISAFFCVVFYLGLILAIAAIVNLFHVKWFGSYIYIDLWAATIGFLIPMSFLAIHPLSYEETDSYGRYPKPLRIFAQYILITVAFIYFVILYAYAIQILVKWELPNGWVSGLILAYAAVGLVSLLLVYPIKEREEIRWIRLYSRGFFITIFPLLILMYFAVTRRISDYGITENRYFLIALMIWLLGISVYYSITGFRKIKYLPMSLAIVAIIISTGPWSAFSISENSQVNRFVRLLKENRILVDGRIMKVKSINENAGRNIQSVVGYLEANHGLNKLKDKLIEVTDADKELRNDSLGLYQALKIDWNVLENSKEETRSYSHDVSAMDTVSYDISGFNYFFKYNASYRIDSIDRKSFANGGDRFDLALDRYGDMRVVINDDMSSPVIFNINRIARHLSQKYKYEIPDSELIYENESRSMAVRLIINTFEVKVIDSSYRIENLDAFIMIRKKG